MSLRADTASLVPGKLVASRYAGLGVHGSAIPTTGTSGGSIGANDVKPGDEDKEFIFEILSKPSGGTVDFAEDGSFEASGFADGVHTGTYRLKVGGVVILKGDGSDPIYTLKVGVAVPQAFVQTLSASMSAIGAWQGAVQPSARPAQVRPRRVGRNWVSARARTRA